MTISAALKSDWRTSQHAVNAKNAFERILGDGEFEDLRGVIIAYLAKTTLDSLGTEQNNTHRLYEGILANRVIICLSSNPIVSSTVDPLETKLMSSMSLLPVSFYTPEMRDKLSLEARLTYLCYDNVVLCHQNKVTKEARYKINVPDGFKIFLERTRPPRQDAHTFRLGHAKLFTDYFVNRHAFSERIRSDGFTVQEGNVDRIYKLWLTNIFHSRLHSISIFPELRQSEQLAILQKLFDLGADIEAILSRIEFRQFDREPACIDATEYLAPPLPPLSLPPLPQLVPLVARPETPDDRIIMLLEHAISSMQKQRVEAYHTRGLMACIEVLINSGVDLNRPLNRLPLPTSPERVLTLYDHWERLSKEFVRPHYPEDCWKNIGALLTAATTKAEQSPQQKTVSAAIHSAAQQSTKQ